MTTVTINGNTYSDDGSSPKDMLNGGHRSHFLPMVGDVATVAGTVATQAAQAAIDAANAANGALATKGTSTTSLAVGAGSKSITTQSGKQFTVGNFVTISRTSAPTTLMHGVVTAYAGTALTVDVATIAGSGTYTDWTIALSGAKGADGPSGNGVMPYASKTGAYTVTAADKGSLIDCTSGTFTLSFQAAATLGANWSTYIRNSGTGVVTLDPSGAETIDGVATYTLGQGNGVLVQCDGSVLRTMLVVDNKIFLLPILSNAAENKTPLSALEVIENNTPATGLTGAASSISYATGQFVVTSGTAGSAATSPDGNTWTLRAMPSSAAWVACVDGVNCVAVVPGATTVANSTNSGVTWASGGALPGTARSSLALVMPSILGGICLVPATTASTVYRSTDTGGTWSTETLPAALGGNMGIYKVGGLFWYWSSATTAYTSPTGLTGSWTSRTLPITPGNSLHSKDFDDSLLITTGAGGAVYSSADGINWVLQALSETYFGGFINGVPTKANGPTSYTKHAKLASRSSSTFGIRVISTSFRAKSSTVFVAPASLGTVARIDPTAADAAIGQFTL
jgi:hypothetical protein